MTCLLVYESTHIIIIFIDCNVCVVATACGHPLSYELLYYIQDATSSYCASRVAIGPYAGLPVISTSVCCDGLVTLVAFLTVSVSGEDV